MSNRYHFLYLALLLTLLVLFAAGTVSAQTNPFINELHYDNTGLDVDEFVEIAGNTGTDLTGWIVRLYNGSTGATYSVIQLSGVLPDNGNGCGFLAFFEPGIQNGSPDGLALVDDNGTVLQFLSYEGTFFATDGEASGMQSVDIMVSESSSTPVGHSLQLAGAGGVYEDYVWQPASANTAGRANTGQTCEGGTVPVETTSWGAVKTLYSE